MQGRKITIGGRKSADLEKGKEGHIRSLEKKRYLYRKKRGDNLKRGAISLLSRLKKTTRERGEGHITFLKNAGIRRTRKKRRSISAKIENADRKKNL